MLNKTTLRSLRIAATRNSQFRRKVLLFIGTGAMACFLFAGALAWGGYQLVVGASGPIRQVAESARMIDINSCLAAITDLSAPGYWLDSSIGKNLDETLARCKQTPADQCQGDACLNDGQRIREVET